MSDLSDVKARLEELIIRADRVERRLETREWTLRQTSLLLDGYLENALEFQRVIAEHSAWLKALGSTTDGREHRSNANPKPREGKVKCNASTSPVRSRRKEVIRRS